jgi:hypothetical protein
MPLLHTDAAAISGRLETLARIRCKKCTAPVGGAITDITNLLIQVSGLHAALIQARRETADHLAAIYAALGAADDGESDPLAYLRDEYPEYDHVSGGGDRLDGP